MSTKSWTTAAAGSACRSTRPTAFTARRATSRIRTRSSTGRPRKADRDPTTSRCRNSRVMTEIWRPSPERVARANLTRFMAGLQLSDYDALYAWSVAHPAEFWTELARFAGVRADWGSGPAIADAAAMPGARFFPSARLNYAENLLRYGDDVPALVFRN